MMDESVRFKQIRMSLLGCCEWQTSLLVSALVAEKVSRKFSEDVQFEVMVRCPSHCVRKDFRIKSEESTSIS